MRIVYLHQYFVTPEMSGGTRSYEFAKRLVADGHEVHMITSDMKGSGKSYETYVDGIKVTWIPVAYSNKMGAIQRIRAFLAFAVKSSVVASGSPADVVFATSTPLTIAIPGIYSKWRQKIPMVFEVRDPWPEMLIGMGAISNPIIIKAVELMRTIAYRNAKHIITLSEGMKKTIVKTGYDSERITVITNSSDLDKFNVAKTFGASFRGKNAWLGNRKLVLYAGALGYANNVGYLVEIAGHALALDPEVRFLVVGTGTEEARIRTLAKKLGVLDANFFMIPPVPKSEVPALFAAADISTVLLRDVPELWTNSSNKFFDALASGRPVAVNGNGWQQELIENHDAGLLLDPNDPASAAQRLLSVLQNENWLDAAGKNARFLAESKFDRNSLYDSFLTVLKNAMNNVKEAQK